MNLRNRKFFPNLMKVSTVALASASAAVISINLPAYPQQLETAAQGFTCGGKNPGWMNWFNDSGAGPRGVGKSDRFLRAPSTDNTVGYMFRLKGDNPGVFDNFNFYGDVHTPPTALGIDDFGFTFFFVDGQFGKPWKLRLGANEVDRGKFGDRRGNYWQFRAKQNYSKHVMVGISRLYKVVVDFGPHRDEGIMPIFGNLTVRFQTPNGPVEICPTTIVTGDLGKQAYDEDPQPPNSVVDNAK